MRAVTIEDLRQIAKRRLPGFVFHPMETGCGNGAGPVDNVMSFRKLRFLGKVLTNLPPVTSRVSVFGRVFDSAFGVAPMGYAEYFRRNADSHMAQAASEANIPFVLSGGSNGAIEQVATISPQTIWCQLYGTRDAGVLDDFVTRACDSGAATLVYTVDFQSMPQNDWLARTGLGLYGKVRLRTIPYLLAQLLTHPAWTFELLLRPGLPVLESWRRYAPIGSTGGQIHRYYRTQVPAPQGWHDLERVRQRWPGKLVIKGVMTIDDARRAVAMGVDGIMVSNHGGNRLDSLLPPLLILAELRHALGAQFPLFLDGGIRRGSDILAAYCLGASFCFVGRAILYGVTAGGLSGARRAIQILRMELEQAMCMLGISNIGECGADMIRERFRSFATATI